MNFILVAQYLLITVFIIISGIFLYELIKYRRLKRIFKSDYLEEFRKSSMRRYNPLIPGIGSTKYKEAQLFINKTGWKLSVEQLFSYKLLLFMLGIMLTAGIQVTNQFISCNEILRDVNYNKIIIDKYIPPTPETIQLELNLYSLVDQKVSNGRFLYDSSYTKTNLEYINNILINCRYEIQEATEAASKRLLEKLKAVRAIKADYKIYLFGIVIALILYMLPELLGRMKIKLIEDRKDWEVLNCIYAFIIFGRLPPYSIRLVLENMSMVADVYKPLINQLLEGIKKGYGDKAFDGVLEKTDSDDLHELFETMKLACDTGILNAVDNIEEAAEQKLKWLEIKGIKRRKAKRLYAMTLVAIMFLLAGIYFSYGLTILSNPAYLMPMQ